MVDGFLIIFYHYLTSFVSWLSFCPGETLNHIKALGSSALRSKWTQTPEIFWILDVQTTVNRNQCA